jgi:aminoglycoside/choline kinase family phosphotransferase
MAIARPRRERASAVAMSETQGTSGGLAMNTQDDLRQFAARTLGGGAMDWEPLTGGGSDRRYVRVRANGRAAVAVMTANAAELRAFLGFTRHFAARGIPVPAILDTDAARCLYLLEDLGPQTLCEWLASQDGRPGAREQRLGAIERAVRWLPVIQVQGGEGLDYGLCLSDAVMGTATYEADLRLFLGEFVARFAPNEQPDAAQARALSALAERCGALEAKHFCYRDFQTRNIMWRDDAPVFIDYQSGRRGPLVYDLVSILYSPDSRLDEAGRESLIDAYLTALQASGAGMAREDFLRDFYPLVLLRRLQALGAYARMALRKGKREHLRNIAPSLATLRELAERGRIAPDSPALRNWLLAVLDRSRDATAHLVE